jgi:hypothetical protein
MRHSDAWRCRYNLPPDRSQSSTRNDRQNGSVVHRLAFLFEYGKRVSLNEIEHARLRDETVTDYIARSIRALKRFARQYEVVVIVVAHPTKDVGRDGKARPVTLYDVEGSATAGSARASA